MSTTNDIPAGEWHTPETCEVCQRQMTPEQREAVEESIAGTTAGLSLDGYDRARFERMCAEARDRLAAWMASSAPRPRLSRNAAQCTHCLDIIESKHVHDFRRCKCGTIFVDGGLEYARRGFQNYETDVIELCEYTDV